MTCPEWMESGQELQITSHVHTFKRTLVILEWYLGLLVFLLITQKCNSTIPSFGKTASSLGKPGRDGVSRMSHTSWGPWHATGGPQTMLWCLGGQRLCPADLSPTSDKPQTCARIDCPLPLGPPTPQEVWDAPPQSWPFKKNNLPVTLYIYTWLACSANYFYTVLLSLKLKWKTASLYAHTTHMRLAHMSIKW